MAYLRNFQFILSFWKDKKQLHKSSKLKKKKEKKMDC